MPQSHEPISDLQDAQQWQEEAYPAWDLEQEPTCLWCGALSDTDICGMCQRRYEETTAQPSLVEAWKARTTPVLMAYEARLP